MARQRCDRAPAGWECVRDAPHDGPCAAIEGPRGSLCWHDPNSYTDEAGIAHCQLAIGHDGPHRMEW